MLEAFRLSLVARLCLVALALLLAASPPAFADDDDDDDEPDLIHYDELAPDRAWRDAIRLRAVPSSYEGDDVTVAVLDTGISRHPTSRSPRRAST